MSINLDGLQTTKFREPPLLGFANWLLQPLKLSLFWTGDYEITALENDVCLGTPVGPRRLAVMRHVKFEAGTLETGRIE